MKTNVFDLIDDLIAREGGFVDNPDDKGGPTKFGITERVARANGYKGDMKDLPRSFAVALYRLLYWVNPKFHLVAIHAPKVAAELFDTGVNMGPAVATTFLQRALNALNRNEKDYPDITPDGRMGPATLDALRKYLEVREPEGEDVLLTALNALQGTRYIELAEHRNANETFLFGWLLNRVETLGGR